jgi:hypothetical protein
MKFLSFEIYPQRILLILVTKKKIVKKKKDWWNCETKLELRGSFGCVIFLYYIILLCIIFKIANIERIYFLKLYLDIKKKLNKIWVPKTNLHVLRKLKNKYYPNMS